MAEHDSAPFSATRRSRRRNTRRRVLAGGLALGAGIVAVLATGACTTVGYLGQAAWGQAKILCARRPIDRWIADPTTPTDLRARLEEVRRVREFAVEALDLPSGSFRSYVELEREADGSRPRAVVWNVFAAPELSLAPVTWCFPIAGCVAYRGYFTRERAVAFADDLRADGFDTAVSGAAAYSTLGWFDDPLLSTVIEDDPLEIASLLFHEMAHARVWVPGDTELNESFATFVEEEGLRRWAASGAATGAEMEELRRSRTSSREWTDLLLDVRDRLSRVYESELPRAEKLTGKQRIFDELAASCRERTGRSDDDPACAFDNADLVAVGAYHGLVPAFAELLARSGGDLPTFYSRVAALAEVSFDERRESLGAMPDTASLPSGEA